MNLHNQELISRLYEIGAIKFGTYQLKSGQISPLYIDLRMIISYPQLLRQIASMMHEMVKGRVYDCLCGVPYTALPLATAYSLAYNVPMVMRRKEAKEYGTKKLIEGKIEKGMQCLVVEDLITSGSSIFETIRPLEQEGLTVHDIVVVLDRQQGGREHVEAKGYQLKALITMEELLVTLESQGILNGDLLEKIRLFLKDNRC